MAIDNFFNDKIINKKAMDDLTEEELDQLMEILSEAGY
jgi:hypothetical protein